MKLAHDKRVILLASAAALPAAAVAIAILWSQDFTDRTRWTLTALVLISAAAFLRALWERVVRPLQTVSNLLAAMREDDFSIRARGRARQRSAGRGPARGQRARGDPSAAAARRPRGDGAPFAR